MEGRVLGLYWRDCPQVGSLQPTRNILLLVLFIQRFLDGYSLILSQTMLLHAISISITHRI